MKLPALIKKAENDFDVPSFPSTRTQSNLMGFYYRKSKKAVRSREKPFRNDNLQKIWRAMRRQRRGIRVERPASSTLSAFLPRGMRSPIPPGSALRYQSSAIGGPAEFPIQHFELIQTMNLSWKRTLRTASSERSAGQCIAHAPAASFADASKIFHLTPQTLPPTFNLTTPATPLHDAHQAGYFLCPPAAH
jgi:hypothetical protein